MAQPNKVKKLKKRSPIPIYAIAVVWVLFTLAHPLYRPSDYAAVILISAVVFIVAKGVFPTVEYTLPDREEPQAEPEAEQAEEETQTPPSTGDPKLDALIAEKDRALGEMHRLNDAIADETVSRQIEQLEQATEKIIDRVVEHPEKLPQLRRFLNYYLPTTLKILNTYDRMGSAGVSGENIDGTLGRIENILDTIVAAFHKQLDSLFQDEAMDIASDITVLENLLIREGLSDEDGPLTVEQLEKEGAHAAEEVPGESKPKGSWI